jgi:hypothetical protein
MNGLSKPDNPKHSKRIRRWTLACFFSGMVGTFLILYGTGYVVNKIKYKDKAKELKVIMERVNY